MIVNVYATYDSVNASYGPLTLANNNDVAIRNVRITIQNDLQTKSIADDLSLYLLGTYDLKSGVLKPCEPQMIIRFCDLVQKGE